MPKTAGFAEVTQLAEVRSSLAAAEARLAAVTTEAEALAATTQSLELELLEAENDRALSTCFRTHAS